MTSRRDFLKNSALAGLTAVAIPAFARRSAPNQPERKRVLRVAHITDVHLLDQTNAETCFTRVLKEINGLSDKPDLIINTGDSVMDENAQTRETVETRWNVWRRIVGQHNKIPMHSALGNHDVWYGPNDKLDAEYKTDKRYGKQWAMDMLHLPNRYYSFDSQGWRFIALDSINGRNGYGLDDGQFEWLKKTLAETPTTTPIMIFSHVPILSMGALLYLTKRNAIADVKFPTGDMHEDHQRIKDLFHGYKNIKLALSGHVHYIDSIEYLGTKYMCNGAVSGNWWRSPLALDEFPPVYTIIDLYGDGSTEARNVFYDSVV